MSKYTTEVRYICENAIGLDESVGYKDVDSVINEAVPKIFNFDFPIFDEEYRNVICSKILRHFYTREIGFETVGLWKLKLETKLIEIMPYYNQFYKSELLKFNPLYDTDLNTTNVGDKNSENNRTENKTGTSSGTNTRTESGADTTRNDVVEATNTTGNSKADTYGSETGNEKNNNIHYDLYSDTPQGALNGVESQEYLTNARKVTDNANKDDNRVTAQNQRNSYDDSGERTTVGSGQRVRNANVRNIDNKTNIENGNSVDKYNSTESYVVHVIGKQSGNSFSKLLKEFRDTFLNIDMDVINSLNDLFSNLW